MPSEVQMVFYGDETVQVQYANGSRLQLSPCGAEFLFEKPPPISAYPLQQPERTRQRTHFGISSSQEYLQCALDFRNLSATSLYLSGNILTPDRKKLMFTDISEVRWPSPETYDSMISVEEDTGIVKITSVDGHAYLSVPKSQHRFAVRFLCKVSQNIVSSEINREAPKEKPSEKASKTPGSLSDQRVKNNEHEALCQIVQSREPLEKTSCVTETEGTAEPPVSSTDNMHLHTWVAQCFPVASCPEEWKYPLSLVLRYHEKLNNIPLVDPNITTSRILTSHISQGERKEVSILPKALTLSCPYPHLHRWEFCDTVLQIQSDEKYYYPELIKMVWHRGVIYRLTHGNVNSIEIYPGDGSVLKSEGPYLGNYFTCYSFWEGTKEREEKIYSVNNLPPDRPGSPFSVHTVITRATRILQHCAKVKLSVSHNYHRCCWKTVPGMNGSSALPLLLKTSLFVGLGRFIAYSDNKVHAIFADGTAVTLNWDFTSAEKNQVNQGLSLGCCRLTLPDGQEHLIPIEHPGPYKRYVTAVTSWCRGLTQTCPIGMVTHPSSSVPEEKWFLLPGKTH